VLDRNVADMVVFNIRGRFDLDEPPAFVSATMEHIDTNKDALMFERCLEDRWHLRVSD
jgi:hypothetical protein